MGQMNDVFLEYKESLSKLNKGICDINRKINNPNYSGNKDVLYGDRSKMLSMKSELEYIIDWLRLGHPPDRWSGIPNLKAGEGWDDESN